MKSKQLPMRRQWERKLAREHGLNGAAVFVTSVQARYDELLSQAKGYENKALLEPYKEGGAAGYVIPFAEMIEAYYEARGWDLESGKPSKTKLLDLGLEDVASDLWG